ncbi:MAG: hypothetical protein IID39_03200, partial [Planctomycetes bacterium]|nr:hypothetical protein [Planctomycetota bacterium]
LKASSFSDDEETIGDEEIGEHFEKYRTFPRKGVRGLSFGYFQPAQVKVEYILMEVDKIAPNLRIGEKTLESKAREFWRQNRTEPRFRRPPDTLPQPEPGEEIGDPPSPYFETFDEAREVALTEVRRQFAREEAEKIAEWLVGQLVEPWYDQSEGPDGYKETPDGVLEADYFDTVLERLPKKWQYGDAVRIEMTDFIRDGEVHLAQPVGRCVVRMPGGQSRAFADLAFLVQGIAPMPTDTSVDTSFYLAKGQAGPMPLSGLNQDQLVYRIVEVKPPAEPASAGEVRDQVAEDLRLLHAYQRATEAAELLAAAAASDGLKAAFDADEEFQPDRRGVYFSPRPFTRRITTSLRPGRSSIQAVAGVGIVDETFVEECLALAENPEGQRIGVIPVETLPAAVVVEWVETIRLSAEEYAAQRERVGAQLNSSAMSQAVGEWLAPDHVRLRNNFTFAQR